jgi:hypothetical protein
MARTGIFMLFCCVQQPLRTHRSPIPDPMFTFWKHFWVFYDVNCISIIRRLWLIKFHYCCYCSYSPASTPLRIRRGTWTDVPRERRALVKDWRMWLCGTRVTWFLTISLPTLWIFFNASCRANPSTKWLPRLLRFVHVLSFSILPHSTYTHTHTHPHHNTELRERRERENALPLGQ